MQANMEINSGVDKVKEEEDEKETGNKSHHPSCIPQTPIIFSCACSSPTSSRCHTRPAMQPVRSSFV